MSNHSAESKGSNKDSSTKWNALLSAANPIVRKAIEKTLAGVPEGLRGEFTEGLLGILSSLLEGASEKGSGFTKAAIEKLSDYIEYAGAELGGNGDGHNASTVAHNWMEAFLKDAPQRPRRQVEEKEKGLREAVKLAQSKIATATRELETANDELDFARRKLVADPNNKKLEGQKDVAETKQRKSSHAVRTANDELTLATEDLRKFDSSAEMAKEVEIVREDFRIRKELVEMVEAEVASHKKKLEEFDWKLAKRKLDVAIWRTMRFAKKSPEKSDKAVGAELRKFNFWLAGTLPRAQFMNRKSWIIAALVVLAMAIFFYSQTYNA